jgi:hypothetical protein
MPQFAVTIEFEDSSKKTLHVFSANETRAVEFAEATAPPLELQRRASHVQTLDPRDPTSEETDTRKAVRKTIGGY